MAPTRQAFVWGFIGETGSGKTTLACEIIKDWRKVNRGGKVIGFDPHDVLKREKLLDHYVTEIDVNWPDILMSKICFQCRRIKNPEKDTCTKCGKKDWRFKFANSLFAADDYRNLLTGNHTPQNVISFHGMKRRIGIDIVYTMHNPCMILERISQYFTHFSIFSSQSSAGDFSSKIAQYVPCQKAANVINQYVLALGGVDSQEYKKLYPNFPHILVTNSSNELNFMNMDNKLVERLKKEGKI